MVKINAELEQFRFLQRYAAILDRGGAWMAVCDLCGNSAGQLHYHELVSRGRTISNEVARRISYEKELCALICPTCHSLAHGPDIRRALWFRLLLRYGRPRISDAIARLQAAMKTQLDIELPTPDEEYGVRILKMMLSMGYDTGELVPHELAGLTEEQYKQGWQWVKDNELADKLTMPGVLN